MKKINKKIRKKAKNKVKMAWLDLTCFACTSSIALSLHLEGMLKFSNSSSSFF
jgi:hypothetical protein